MKKLGNVFILGDSYSTFEGYIPEGNAIYYKKAGREDNDVKNVNETWWHQLLEETESNLIRNSSYSGSVICHTGYDGERCLKTSFIARFNKLAEDGFFIKNNIDTFLLFGGTNDTWANSPLGEMMDSGWTQEDLFNVLPAISYIIDDITKNIPGVKLYCILNDELKAEIADCFKAVCERYEAKYIELKNIDKVFGHPTVKGMQQIKEQVYASI